MSIVHLSLSPSDVVRRGDEIYNRLLRTKPEPDQNGKIVAIDVDSEDYEVGTDVLDTAPAGSRWTSGCRCVSDARR